MAQFASVTSGGTTIESNHDSQADLDALNTPDPAAETPPETPAASEDELPPAAIAEPEKAKTGKPRDDPRARVEQATAREAAARREREEARAENTRLRAELDALKAPKPAAEPEKQPVKQAEWQRYKSMAGAPQLADFDGPDALEDWSTARALFVAEKRFEELRQSERQQEARSRYETAEQAHYRTFEKTLRDAAAEDPDFVSRVDPRILEAKRLSALGPTERATFGNFLAEQVYRSKHPKDLLLHLSDETEVQRLAALPPDEVIRELARFEGRLPSAAAPLDSGTAPTAPVSKAKPPIRPERSTAQVGSDEPPGDDATDAQHEAYWAKHRRKFGAA